MNFCTKCGADITADANYCKNCGKDKRQIQSANASQSAAMAFCSNCGEKSEGGYYCKRCGASLVNTTMQGQAASFASVASGISEGLSASNEAIRRKASTVDVKQYKQRTLDQLKSFVHPSFIKATAVFALVTVGVAAIISVIIALFFQGQIENALTGAAMNSSMIMIFDNLFSFFKMVLLYFGMMFGIPYGVGANMPGEGIFSVSLQLPLMYLVFTLLAVFIAEKVRNAVAKTKLGFAQIGVISLVTSVVINLIALFSKSGLGARELMGLAGYSSGYGSSSMSGASLSTGFAFFGGLFAAFCMIFILLTLVSGRLFEKRSIKPQGLAVKSAGSAVQTLGWIVVIAGITAVVLTAFTALEMFDGSMELTQIGQTLTALVVIIFSTVLSIITCGGMSLVQMAMLGQKAWMSLGIFGVSMPSQLTRGMSSYQEELLKQASGFLMPIIIVGILSVIALVMYKGYSIFRRYQMDIKGAMVHTGIYAGVIGLGVAYLSNLFQIGIGANVSQASYAGMKITAHVSFLANSYIGVFFKVFLFVAIFMAGTYFICKAIHFKPIGLLEGSGKKALLIVVLLLVVCAALWVGFGFNDNMQYLVTILGNFGSNLGDFSSMFDMF